MQIHCNIPECSYWPCSSLWSQWTDMVTTLLYNKDATHKSACLMPLFELEQMSWRTSLCYLWRQTGINSSTTKLNLMKWMWTVHTVYSQNSQRWANKNTLSINAQDNVNTDSLILSASYSLESPNTTMNLLWSSWLACRWLTLFMISRC